MNQLTPREILAKARLGIIDPVRWHQGSLFKEEAACALGWLDRASGYFQGPYGPVDCTNLTPRNAALDYLRRAIGIDTQPFALQFYDVPLWNDDAARTHEEVVSAFDRALMMAAQDEGLSVRSDDARTDPAKTELVLV